MIIDSQKLFIGLMDFFSILLPGAPLTFVLKDDVGPKVLGHGNDETGVWACIVHDLRDVSHSVNGVDFSTRFFRMQALGRGLRKDKQRRHEWLGLPQAIARASYAETRSLLEADEHQRMRT